MPNYATKALHKFQQPTPRLAKYAPHQLTCTNYGEIKQLETPLDNSPPIPEQKNSRIQQLVGIFLYHDHGVDCTMLPALSTIAEQQSNRTQNIEDAITQFLDYAPTNLLAIVRYKYSDMILHVDRYALHLS